MRRVLVVVFLAYSAVAAVSQSDSSEAVKDGASVHHRGHRHDRRDHDRHVCVDPIATKEQMDDMVAYMKKLSFDDEKLEAAKLCVRLCPVPTMGIGRLAKQFSFDKNRKAFLKYAYGYCPDPESYYMLRDLFSFKSDADKLFKELGVSVPDFND